MKRPNALAIVSAILQLLVSAACHWGYGPVQDRSEFVSARLADDGRTAVFTFHAFTYRPATGVRAFPDGGIPQYLTDVNIVGTCDVRTREVRILRREENTEWQPGSGQFTVQDAKGRFVLVGQGGQRRNGAETALKHLLVDLARGRVTDLDLRGDLARRGRDSGQIYLADNSGVLVFVTLSLQEAKDAGAYRDQSLVPEIWVRTPGGAYAKVARSAHYEATRGGEVFYWDPPTRLFMAYSIAAGTTRVAPEYKVQGDADVTEGVIVSDDRKGLRAGGKVAGAWRYQPLEIPVGQLR